MFRSEPPFTLKNVILVSNDVFSVWIRFYNFARLKKVSAEFTESPVCEIFKWHFKIGKSGFRSHEKLTSNRSNWNSWLFLHSAWFEAAGRSRFTRGVCAGKHVCVFASKVAQLPPRGERGPGLQGGKKERKRERARLKEWRDYPHTVDWSLKRSCSVQLGSTSLRRTRHR